MNVGSVGLNFSGRSRCAVSPRTEKELIERNGETVLRTKYFDDRGKLVGYQIAHENGAVEGGREYKNGSEFILWKGYGNYSPIMLKGILKGKFFENLPIRHVPGHSPNRRVVEEKLYEEGKLQEQA